MIEIHDHNVIDVVQDKLHEIIMGEEMDWYYNDSTVNDNDGHYDSPQFTHLIYTDEEIHSSLYQEVAAILALSGKPMGGIVRIKANMLMGNGFGNKPNAPHKDADENHFTILYYVNDSDGDTVFFDDDGKIFKSVKPKKGRMVIFDSDISHTSSSPTDGRRCVLNIILKKINTLENNDEKIAK